MENYKYLIFDAQYFLTRNLKLLDTKKYVKEDVTLSNGEVVKDENGVALQYIKTTYTAMELSRLLFWSIVKFRRDYANGRKIILLWDKYPYHKYEFLRDYKGSRHYATEEDLVGVDRDENPKAYLEIQEDIARNKRKQEAKYWCITNFESMGMKNYIRTGYEADDLACIISEHLENDDQKSAVISKDSDWSYFTRPNIDYITPTGKVITYEDMVKSHKHFHPEIGIDLYEYKSICDSLFGSHNDLQRTLAPDSELPPESLGDIIESVVKTGDSDYIVNKDLFKAQLQSFKLTEYPEYDKVIQSLYYLDKGGSIMSDDQFIQHSIENAFGVSLSYYKNFKKNLDKNLYNG